LLFATATRRIPVDRLKRDPHNVKWNQNISFDKLKRSTIQYLIVFRKNSTLKSSRIEDFDVNFSYVDEEGDKITFSSDVELVEALQNLKETKPQSNILRCSAIVVLNQNRKKPIKTTKIESMNETGIQWEFISEQSKKEEDEGTKIVLKKEEEFNILGPDLAIESIDENTMNWELISEPPKKKEYKQSKIKPTSNYRLMLKVGVSKEAVHQKMTLDKVNPETANTILASYLLTKPMDKQKKVNSTSKYCKMLRVGIPKEAVYQKMTMLDKVDPKAVQAVLGSKSTPPTSWLSEKKLEYAREKALLNPLRKNNATPPLPLLRDNSYSRMMKPIRRKKAYLRQHDPRMMKGFPFSHNVAQRGSLMNEIRNSVHNRKQSNIITN